MKSRDELSLDMARVICPAVSTEKCVNGTCPKLWDCPVKISIFEKLVDKGYGDVSEYKAEIERLESELKQAQIDVLNKLRSRISDRDSLIQSYIADGCLTIEDMYTEIDELIKEIEDAKSKGTN